MNPLLSFLLLFDVVCGTGTPETLRAFPKRAAIVDDHAPPTTRFANDFLFVRADEETVPFDDPNDLEGVSLHFRRRDAQTFEVTRRPLAYDNALGRVDGDTITLYVPEELLVLDSRTNRLLVQTGTSLNADELSLTLDLGPQAPSAEIDFSAIDTLTAARPLIETFRLGRVNVAAVWDRLKREFGCSDADIDAVAVYSSFYSDLITSQYGAFASLSNPGADGVSPSYDADAPKTATLLNMNALDFGVNTSARGRTQLLLHEPATAGSTTFRSARTVSIRIR